MVRDHVNNLLMIVDSETGQLIGSEQLHCQIYDVHVHLTGDQLIVRHGPVMDLSFYSVSFQPCYSGVHTLLTFVVQVGQG